MSTVKHVEIAPGCFYWSSMPDVCNRPAASRTQSTAEQCANVALEYLDAGPSNNHMYRLACLDIYTAIHKRFGGVK